MRTIRIEASTGYDVAIGEGLLAESGERIAALGGNARTAMIVSDDTVYGLYGGPVRESIERAGLVARSFVFEHGERNKNLAAYGKLLEAMAEERMTRDDLVVALGGGVTGDLAGFAAATYRRGIRFVQIPTTLLAAVDSSVGGKTGVDLPNGKNQAGCFWQPSLVLIDPETLRTLPDGEYRAGCAEVIKYGMIGSEELFRAVSETPVRERFAPVIDACVRMKRDLVEADEFDRGERMKLNFGHTFGHAAEFLSGYRLPHGFAVAAGMAAVTRAAVPYGYCGEETLEALLECLERYGLPAAIPYGADAMREAVLSDKKASGGAVRLVVPERIGSVRIVTAGTEELPAWLARGGVGTKDLSHLPDCKGV